MRETRQLAFGLGALGKLAIAALAYSDVGASSLVLYLPFDENAGDVAHDETSHGNDATLMGSASWGEGQYGSGLSLGDGAHAEVAHHGSLNLTDGMTLMCWTRILGDTGGDQSALEKGASWQAGEYNLLPVYTGAVLLQMFDLPDACDDDYAAGDVTDGAWHHIAGTWDGDHVRVYVDAAEVGGGPCSGVLGTNEEPLYIGARGGASSWVQQP